jgi:hypothetical protein
MVEQELASGCAILTELSQFWGSGFGLLGLRGASERTGRPAGAGGSAGDASGDKARRKNRRLLGGGCWGWPDGGCFRGFSTRRRRDAEENAELLGGYGVRAYGFGTLPRWRARGARKMGKLGCSIGASRLWRSWRRGERSGGGGWYGSTQGKLCAAKRFGISWLRFRCRRVRLWLGVFDCGTRFLW